MLLHEAEGHSVTVELKNGEIYRGLLDQAEDTMNCQLKEVTMTGSDGRLIKMENVYLRGSLVKFIVLPDLLKNAPAFKKVQTMQKKLDKTRVPGAGKGSDTKKPKK